MANKETISKDRKKWLRVFMHILAVVVLLWGIIEASTRDTTTVIHQILVGVWQVKFLLYAIFFELVALNCK